MGATAKPLAERWYDGEPTTAQLLAGRWYDGEPTTAKRLACCRHLPQAA